MFDYGSAIAIIKPPTGVLRWRDVCGMTERDIQRQAVKWLRKEGYDVIVTSNGRRTANTRGTPDLFVWVKDRWYAFDTKMPGGKLSPEQLRLFGQGKLTIYTSLEQLKSFLT